ncbi:fibrinogen C domain-containing protein 1-like [Dysidea avara]|uniref:fibrinogen C domain-containing protein 1-like n=1 Tax=Dysidea avara TaxID=196820 RepID=UPI00331E4697
MVLVTSELISGGLKAIHTMTQTGQWECFANNKTWTYFHYDHFSVGCASEEYPLSVGGYKGTVFKGLYDGHDGARFSTCDNDFDKAHFTCAIISKCGWWYYVCDAINPSTRGVTMAIQ